MKTLNIVWQRLISDEGTTCPRCHSTGQEVVNAVARLKYTLEPLGIEPKLESREISHDEFLKDTSKSNEITINGKTVESLLEGKTGSSQCCNECGDNQCRTVDIGDQSYEVIPEDLIVRAGIVAATQMLDPTL